LHAIGEDPDREGLRDTPKRVSEMYAELFSGLASDPAEAIDAVFDEQSQDPVVMRNVVFHSVCEHHLLPFFGSVNLAYIPKGKLAGFSKLARAVEVAAKRPQVQERLTGQVAEAIYNTLHPHVVAVEIEAEHLCMAMRGVRKPGSKVITTAIRGSFAGLDIVSRDLLILLRGIS